VHHTMSSSHGISQHLITIHSCMCLFCKTACIAGYSFQFSFSVFASLNLHIVSLYATLCANYNKFKYYCTVSFRMCASLSHASKSNFSTGFYHVKKGSHEKLSVSVVSLQCNEIANFQWCKQNTATEVFIAFAELNCCQLLKIKYLTGNHFH